MAEDFVIEMLHITKEFPGIKANDDITLQLRKGEVHALLGENGAGKSTLMSVLFGLYQPEEGKILKNGKEVAIRNPNDANALGIGMVHQHFKLVECFSVLDNIILGVEPNRMGFLQKAEARKKVMALSEKYGLRVDPDALISDISVGMQQRVEILKMLYRDNEILIFDEPTAVLTPQEIDELMQIMKNLAAEGKSILFEGAQGTLLDIDHGTYPYVTSSSCCAGGAATGSGVGPVNIDRVLGIQKAYITRVGGGPFPTELTYAEDGGEGLEAEEGETLCQVGHEYGVTTGRKRRCGWFDAVIARYAADVNGLTDVALTKLDVLSAFDTIKVCVAYECNGERYDYFPMQQSVLFHAKPVYEELPGWKGEDITACRTFDELPENAKSYVEYLEKKVGVPISIVAVGPDRDQTIMRGW